MIEVQDLFKFYAKRRAVGPLSFSIAQGEIVGLLGLNGAGKTTTLRVLACDLLPSSGTVVVDSYDVVDRPEEVRRRVGYLPDHPPLYGEMRTREYLLFAARLRGLGPSEAAGRIGEVGSQTGLNEVLDEPIASLSHGYRQRIGIAQAIVHKPKLLILDEPILGLDPVQIVGMRQLLRTLRGQYTILLSSHILSEISETCDRLLVLRDGEIVASGTEAELSARLLRGLTLLVTVKGEAEPAVRVLQSLPGVTKAEAVTGHEVVAGETCLRVMADTDVRALVVERLVEAHLAVLGLMRSEHELESIFMRLAGPGLPAQSAQAEPAPKEQPVEAESEG